METEQAMKKGAIVGWLALFAVAMGWLEAVIVEYIRRLIGMEPGVDFAGYLHRKGVVSLDAFNRFLVEHHILFVERTREAATIVMLIAVSMIAFKKWRMRLAAFLWTFAIWDLSYYAGLFIRLRWPASIREIDCLFLIPFPWFAPVWFPLVVMAGLLVFSAALFRSGCNSDK